MQAFAQKEQIVAGIYGAGPTDNSENPTLEALVEGLGGKMFRTNQEAMIVD